MIPQSIDFVTDSLNQPELEKVTGWYNFLKEPDRPNVDFVIQYLHARSLQVCGPGRCPEHAFSNAIGSTVSGKKDYNDIDFLWICGGGCPWKPSYLYAVSDQWEVDLRSKFKYNVDHEILNKEYRGFLCQGMPDRSLIELVPKQGEGKSIHIVVQPEINLESQWDDADDEPRIVLDRVKNKTGGFFAAMGKLMGEVFPDGSED